MKTEKRESTAGKGGSYIAPEEFTVAARGEDSSFSFGIYIDGFRVVLVIRGKHG